MMTYIGHSDPGGWRDETGVSVSTPNTNKIQTSDTKRDINTLPE